MLKLTQSITRRKFIQTATMGAVGGAVLSNIRCGISPTTRGSNLANPMSLSGVLLATSNADQKLRLDLISLSNHQILATFEGIDATHAVVPVEHLNRFFVHGYDPEAKQGMIWGLEINPKTEDWRVIYDYRLDGGPLLHWQPNRDYSLIQYNSIESEALHVLDTQSLDLHTYQGGGTHSNMAFFNGDRWLIATDHLGDRAHLRVIDRVTNQVLAETPVGNWAHGVTVNDRTGQAFVWANEGVHRVSLAQRNLGTHLGVIPAFDPSQRSWFCWTPQGGRYSHDQTFTYGDIFQPWLTVIDMEQSTLEKIPTGSETPGTLQISADGKFGISGSHSSDNICLFDIAANTFLGTVPVGRTSQGFFDRDAGFSRDRKVAYVTNPPEQTVTVIDMTRKQEIGKINLPAKPLWMKVLTA